MANSDITRIVNNAKLHLPGALDDVVKLELFNVVDELLRDGAVWREEASVAVVSGTTEYEVDIESVANVQSLVSLVNADEIEVKARLTEPEILVLETAPTQSETLTATFVLAPKTTDSDGYPSIATWIWKKYYQGILDGLLGRMMAHPVKPYTNERLAILHMRKFNNVKTQARADATRAHLNSAQAWRFPGFA